MFSNQYLNVSLQGAAVYTGTQFFKLFNLKLLMLQKIRHSLGLPGIEIVLIDQHIGSDNMFPAHFHFIKLGWTVNPA